jgi:uncharacterized protein YjbJ (UPF0337 family)
MDDDRTKGSMKQMKGSFKEGAGRALGDSKLEADGKMDRTEGRFQNFIGGLKDMFRGRRT